MKRTRTAVWTTWIIALLLLTACAGEAVPTPTAANPGPADPTALPDEATSTPTSRPPASSPTPTPSPTPAADLLDCEAGGYPCALSEMSEEAVERAADLSQDAEARMRGGNSAFEVAEWLETQEGVVVEATDGRAIIYRVADSVPVVVEHPGVEGVARRSPTVDSAPVNGRSLASRVLAPARYVPPVLAPESLSQPTIGESTDVVGWRRDDRNVKRALVLAPYQWHFDDNSDGLMAAEMLESTRWYKGRVTVIANPQQSDQNVTVQDFMNWDQYDTIHVDSHGKSICREGEDFCRAYLNTGHRIPRSEFNAYVRQHPEIRGVAIGFDPVGDEIELLVLDDFFRLHYGPGALKNKVLYFSACEILAQSDVLKSFDAAGENSDLFAWTYTVNADDAFVAARAVYEGMTLQGQSAGDAYERVPDSIKLNRPSELPDYELARFYGVDGDGEKEEERIKRTQTTDLKHHVLGGQRTNHVREVITLLHPETQETLWSDTVYPIDGTLGDGKPEQIELVFRVEGYTQQEIEEEELTISFSLDGAPVVVDRSFLPAQDEQIEVEAEGEFAWRVQFEEVEIPDQQPLDEVVFLAELALPGGASSVHEVDPVKTSQRDVRAIFGSPPLVAGQSFTVALDRDSQVARADLTVDGERFVLYYDQEAGLGYYPTPQGGYWTIEGALGEVLISSLIPVDWPVRRLEEGGFVRETYACGEEECDRYRSRQEGVEMVLSYDQRSLLVQLNFNSAEGNGTIYYEYEPVDVSAPANAVPAPAPFPFMAPSVPIPDLP